jgi:hypothetical protein
VQFSAPSWLRRHSDWKYSFTVIVPADPGKGASATRQLRDPDVRDEDEDDFDEDDSW